MTNRGGGLHGGCTATLIDCISTIGLMTSRTQAPGVSLNLNVRYIWLLFQNIFNSKKKTSYTVWKTYWVNIKALLTRIFLYFSYLKGAVEGDEIIIETKTVKSGKTIAFLEALLSKKNSGEIIATGTHTKFIG